MNASLPESPGRCIYRLRMVKYRDKKGHNNAPQNRNNKNKNSMARAVTTPEGSRVEIQRKKQHRIVHVDPAIPDTATLTATGNFDAEFDTGNRADLKSGDTILHPMTRDPGTGVWSVDIDNLEIGRTYYYTIHIDYNDPNIPERFIGKQNIKIVEESPSVRNVPLVEIRKNVKEGAMAFVESLKSRENLGGADALIQAKIGRASCRE